MRTAEEWHFKWAADNYHDERLMEMLRAVQADAIEACAKVCVKSAAEYHDDHLVRNLMLYRAHDIRALLPKPPTTTETQR